MHVMLIDRWDLRRTKKIDHLHWHAYKIDNSPEKNPKLIWFVHNNNNK